MKEIKTKLVKMSQSQEKVMVLLRGVSGSGKSTVAKEIGGEVFSTDDYFMKDGEYQFNPKELTKAHAWNRNRVKEALENGVSPVVVDNTNTQKWEMREYVKMAQEYGYDVQIREPSTPWKRDVDELTERNNHRVPKEAIEKMLNRWEELPEGSLGKEQIEEILQSKAPWEK